MLEAFITGGVFEKFLIVCVAIVEAALAAFFVVLALWSRK